MNKNSMANLSETIQKKLQADQEAVKNQTSELLKMHADGLKKLSVDALSTTKTAINLQSLELDKLHSETLEKVKWLMLWPLLASLLLSLFMLLAAGGWSWQMVSRAENRAEQILSEQRMKIKRMNDEFCSSPAGKTYCRPS